MPTTLRIALLAGLLALLSNLAVIGFIYCRTHDEAVASLRRQVVEQSASPDRRLSHRRQGRARRRDRRHDHLRRPADRGRACSIPTGARSIGNLAPAPVAADPCGGLSQRRSSGCAARPTPHEARDRRSAGCRAASGWSAAALVGEGLAFRADARALAAHRARRRRAARSAVRRDPRPLCRRAGSATSPRSPTASARATSASACRCRGAGDSFDRLGMQINAMLDRISALMEELRLLTDSLAHDLRSPVSRLRAAAHAAAETERSGRTGGIARQRRPPMPMR